MTHVDWATVNQEEYNGACGFSCVSACPSRGRTGCQCNYCLVLEMMFSLVCPFCDASCSATPDEEGQALVKNWMGTHLANVHQNEMNLYEKYLGIKCDEVNATLVEDTNEWVNIRHPLGYQYTA